jgi:hypothetical protein
MSTRTLKLNSFFPTVQSTVRTASNSEAKAAPARRRNSNWVGITSLLTLVLVTAGLGFYVYMINAYASKGYDLKKQQAAMQELTATEKRLVVEQAALGAIGKVNEVASATGMVPVTSEEFLAANQLSSAQ